MQKMNEHVMNNFSGAFPTSMLRGFRTQDQTLATLIEHWNSGLEERQRIVREQNEALKAKHAAHQLSARALSEGLMKIPEKVEVPGKKWRTQFLRSFGWSLISSSTEQASLPYHHPDMEAYRNHYASMISSGVHKHLVLNLDQVWRCAFQFGGKMLFKPRGQVGKRCKTRSVKKTVDKKHHAVRGARRSLTAPRIEL